MATQERDIEEIYETLKTIFTLSDKEKQEIFRIAGSDKEAKINEAKHVFISTGDHMIMVEIWAKDGNDLSRILSKIGKIEGVKKLCPAIILEEIK